MSGDPSLKEPLIFYSEEMTDTKISLLELHGIQLRIKTNKYSYCLLYTSPSPRDRG